MQIATRYYVESVPNFGTLNIPQGSTVHVSLGKRLSHGCIAAVELMTSSAPDLELTCSTLAEFKLGV